MRQTPYSPKDDEEREIAGSHPKSQSRRSNHEDSPFDAWLAKSPQALRQINRSAIPSASPQNVDEERTFEQQLG